MFTLFRSTTQTHSNVSVVCACIRAYLFTVLVCVCALSLYGEPCIAMIGNWNRVTGGLQHSTALLKDFPRENTDQPKRTTGKKWRHPPPPPPHHDMLGRLTKRKVKRKEVMVLLRLNELNQNGKGTKRNKKSKIQKKEGKVWFGKMKLFGEEQREWERVYNRAPKGIPTKILILRCSLVHLNQSLLQQPHSGSQI